MTGLKRSLDETEIECNFKNNLEVLENEQGATVISEGLSIGIDNIPGPDESIDSLDQIGTASNDSSELGHQCNISSIISQETLPEVSEMEIIAPTTGPQHKIVHKKLKIKNPASVWMIFSNENRDLIYKEFPLMNFTEVAKTLAERYRNISPETRDRLESLSKAEKERYAAEVLAAKSTEGNTAEDDLTLGSLIGSGGGTSIDLELPLGRVRKIVKLDSDVKNIGKEATIAISKATELFIAYLGLRCANTAIQRGVRTVKDQDIVHTIHSLDTLDFLRLDFPRAQKPFINEGKEKKTHNRLSLAQSTPSGSNIKDFFVAPRSVVGSAIGNSFASTSATTVSTADGADAAAKVGYVNEFSKEEGGNG